MTLNMMATERRRRMFEPNEKILQVAHKIGKATKAKKIILFGSYAQNTATKDSDVDFLVIAESNLPRYKRSRKLYLLFNSYPFAMDILIYTPEEIKKELQFTTSFISWIMKEGKEIYAS